MSSVSVDDRANFVDDFTEQFWSHIVPVVKVAFAIHIALLALFLYLDVTVLWVTNIGSVILYLIGLRAVGQKRFQAATLYISLEIVIHASVATWKLGWGSNFYLYLFCMVPIIAFNFNAARYRAWGLNGVVLLFVVGGVLVRSYVGSAPGIPAVAVDVFAASNAFIATALLLQATDLCVRFSWGAQLNLLQDANRDTLTNLYTRRRLLQCVKKVNRARTYITTALILLDIDHFKLINDRYGHAQGDDVLRLVAEAITLCVRQTDVACRWGGEEFLILMPDTTITEAENIAARLKTEIAGLVVPNGMHDAGPITVTISVSIIRSDESFSEALMRTDELLYAGKKKGRDRIEISQ